MRLLPISMKYSGLTIVLSSPSRFDPARSPETLAQYISDCTAKHRRADRPYLSSLAGDWLDESLVKAGFINVCRDSVELRLLSDVDEPFLAGTKCVLCLGEEAVERLVGGVSLGEQRGSPVMRLIGDSDSGSLVSVPFIFSYSPQDAQDRQNYEDDEDEVDEVDNPNDVKSTRSVPKRKEWKWWLRKDIQKAVRISQTGLKKTVEPKYHLWPELEIVVTILLNARNVNFYGDWETLRSLLPTCFGFSVDEGENIYIVPLVQTHEHNQWFYGEAGTARFFWAMGVAMLRNIFVAHYAGFDLFVAAWRIGIPLPKRAFCTMVGHNVVWVEQSKGLGQCISLYTDLPFHKNDGVFMPRTHSEAEELYLYNGKDVFALTQIKPEIERQADAVGATENLQFSTRKIIPYLTSTLGGARVDWNMLYEKVAFNEVCMNKCKVVINTSADFPLNPNSSQGKWSVKNYLYSKDGLDIPLPKTTPTNEKVLRRVQLTHKTEIIPWIIRYRGLGKEGAFKRDDEDNIILIGGRKKAGGQLGFYPWEQKLCGQDFTEPRYTTSWGIGNTVTFRRNAKKLLGIWGGNFQNWSKNLRKCIIPDEGKTLFQIDESGADAMIVAYLCEHGNFRELFLCGIKPHSFLALHLFKDKWQEKLKRHPGLVQQLCLLSIKDLAKHPRWKGMAKFIASSDDWPAAQRYYFIAKMVCHASNYGQGPNTFRDNVLLKSEGFTNLSLNEAKYFLDFFHKLFPEVRLWHKWVQEQLKRHRLLRNRFNHPRQFTGAHMDDSMYREAYSFDPQSTVGQIIGYAVCEFYELLEAGDEMFNDYQVDFWQDGHDALMGQALTKGVKEVGKRLQGRVNRLLVSPRNEEFRMKSSLQVGKNWGFK